MPNTDGPFPIYTRREWMPRETRTLNPIALPVPFIFVHHIGAGPTINQRSPLALAQWLEAIADGEYSDGVPYNYAIWISTDGKRAAIVELRGNKQGAATRAFNDDSIAILLAGNFDGTDPATGKPRALPDIAVKAAQYLIGALKFSRVASVQAQVLGHRDGRALRSGATATSCPGSNAYLRMSTIRMPYQPPAPPPQPDIPPVRNYPPPVGARVHDWKVTKAGVWLLWSEGSVWTIAGAFPGSAVGYMPVYQSASQLLLNADGVPEAVLTNKGVRVNLRKA